MRDEKKKLKKYFSSANFLLIWIFLLHVVGVFIVAYIMGRTVTGITAQLCYDFFPV